MTASIRRWPFGAVTDLTDERSKYFPSPLPESALESMCSNRSAFNKSACDTAWICIGNTRQLSNHSESKYMRFIIHLIGPQYHQNAADIQIQT